MARQNLTIQLDQETIRQAKVIAAQRGISVSKLVAATIEQIVAEEQEYEAARRTALAHLDEGFTLGGRILATRDELHER